MEDFCEPQTMGNPAFILFDGTKEFMAVSTQMKIGSLLSN